MIDVPEIFEGFCTDRVLCMKFCNGKSLKKLFDEVLDNNSANVDSDLDIILTNEVDFDAPL